MGLTPCFLYSAITSSFCSPFLGSRRPMFLNLALMTSICGFSACILRIDFMLASFSGNRTKLMATVTSTIAQPKLCTRLSLTQLTSRKSGLARMDIQPKSTTDSSLGLIFFNRSISLGPTYTSKRLAGPSLMATPLSATGVCSWGVLTVSPKRRGAEDSLDQPRVVHQVPVGEHDAPRGRGRPRGVLQERGGLGIDRGRAAGLARQRRQGID